jgi:hypothetical protein
MEPHPDDHRHLQGEHVDIDEKTLLRHLFAEAHTWLSGDPKTFRVEDQEFDSKSILLEPKGSNSRMIQIREWSADHKLELAGVVAIGALLYSIHKVQAGRKSK